jgi:hypothetical protein
MSFSMHSADMISRVGDSHYLSVLVFSRAKREYHHVRRRLKFVCGRVRFQNRENYENDN